MPKRIGIVACSAEGAALCYRTICAEAPDLMEAHGMLCKIPDEDELEKIDGIIFKELVNGIFTEPSRLYFNAVIQKLKNKGCDGVILGCTEIPLLVDPDDCPLPVLDSTRLLARAALKEALMENESF